MFRKEIEKLTDDLSTSKKLLEEQERYLRRNNVILVGFLENPNENLNDAMGTILSDKLKIPSSDIKLARVYRLGKLREGQYRAIFLGFNTASDKAKIMSVKFRLKGTNLFLNHDLSKNQRIELAQLRKQKKKKKYNFITDVSFIENTPQLPTHNAIVNNPINNNNNQ